MNDASLLHRFNKGLHDIREVFHKTGRLDDSNAKLDEVVKLLSLEIASAYEPKGGVPSLSALVNAKSGPGGVVKSINDALGKASKLEIFRNADGESLLGSNPRLNLADSEGELASKLANLVVETFNGHLKAPGSSKTFEAVNEAFGHFVRDNFRNNIEDAQYMTPPEVVDFACELALRDAQRIVKGSNASLIVCDPSCGVGSFLAQFYRVWLHSHVSQRGTIKLVGQDKVDRMARLAKLNMLLFGARSANIARGNSVLKGSELDQYNGRCDIIVTNPPFGARFHTSELAFHSRENFPCLHDFIQSADALIDSELLFIDRYLSLLKPGGVAYAIVPDAVISASGLPSQVREYLGKKCTVLSITELPAVTFAQAGTRTKTCLLHFRKEPPTDRSRVSFSCAKSLGFEVASRKGVPYKKHEGENELPAIREALLGGATESKGGVSVIRNTPSCVSVDYKTLFDSPWTPSHHSAERYATLAALDERTMKGGVELKRLRELVTLPNKHKRGMRNNPTARCISVLHVGDFGALNVRELMAYSPKYPGQSCSPGDVLFSKINPRIPRAVVVPELGIPLTCSTEFEVMRPIDPYSAHEIMLLLLSSQTQSQVQSLTSGTSSSHNRIKTEQLLEVLLHVPKGKRRESSTYSSLVKEFGDAHRASIQASIGLNDSWNKMNELLRG
jgi:hypothetical protein